MKLRVKENLLQFKITRQELAALLVSERLEETVQFAAVGDSRITYVVEAVSASQKATLKYEADEIRIVLSLQDVKQWAQHRDLGMFKTIDLGERGILEIFFEKDFDIFEPVNET